MSGDDDDFAPAPVPQHDLMGTKTFVGELIRQTKYVIPVLPPGDTPVSRAISQRQFHDLIHALLGGLTNSMACALSGIDLKTHNEWMRRGARGSAAGLADAFTIYYHETTRAKANHAAWLQGRLLDHIIKDKDPKALLEAMKRHGFDEKQASVEEEEAQDEAIYEALGNTLPKVQT